MGSIYQRTRKEKDGTRVPSGPFWIAYYRNGKQLHESTGSTKRKEAENLLRTREGDIVRGVPVSPKVNQLRFEKARDHFLTYQENNLRTGHAAVDARRAKQHQKTKRRIELRLTPFFGGRRMVSITPVDIERYKAERREQKASPATINRELTMLKRMFSLAVKAGLLYHKPHIELLREAPPRNGFFEDAQIAALLRHLPEAVAPVVEFAWRTGWRITSEVLPLEWRSVDFAAGEVRLDPGTTKNGQGRVIKMSQELRALLEGRKREADALKATGTIVPWVFWRMVSKGRRGTEGHTTTPKRITTFGKAWKVACKQAGCPGRIPHDLRRTAVRNFIRAGIPQAVAKKLTGHQTDAVFNRYNIVSEGDLVDAAQRIAGRHVVSK